MKISKLLLAASALALTAGPVLAQEKTVLTPHKLRGAAYIVEGGTANAGFVIGKDGVIVIDPQRTEEEAKTQIAAIAAITDKPIKTIIVSHSDPDHLGGLPAYSAEAEVITHENTLATIKAAVADAAHGGPFFGPLYQRIASGFLPDRTISASEASQFSGVAVQLLFIAPAHSSGDIAVFLPKEKIVYGGDIILTSFGRFPIIHVGGSSAGWIQSMKAILALDANIFVPGHGKMETRAQLEKRLAAVIERRAAIKTMIERGASFEEINAALPPEIVNTTFPSFNESTYDELTKGWPASVAPWANIAKKPQAAGVSH